MQALAASCEELRARTGNPPLDPLPNTHYRYFTTLYQKYLSDDLERVKKRALATIYRGQPYSESLQQSGLNSLSVRRQTLCEKLFLKISTDSDHKLVHPLLPPKHQAKYNLKHKRLYDLPMTNTNRLRNTFVPSMIYYNN